MVMTSPPNARTSRVHDDNIMVGGERQRGDLLLGRHRLARAGHTGNKAVAVEQVSAIADDEIVRHGIDAVVDAASVLNFL